MELGLERWSVAAQSAWALWHAPPVPSRAMSNSLSSALAAVARLVFWGLADGLADAALEVHLLAL